MRKTLAEIAGMIGGEVVGDGDLVITGLNGMLEAREGELTFLANPKYIPLSKKTQASAIITSRDIRISGKPVIRTDNPSLAFSNLIISMTPAGTHPVKGIHSTAIIAGDADLGQNVAVGPYAVIESKVRVGDNTIIYGGTYIGPETTIGKDCVLYPKVTIREKITVGDRVIIHSGTVIGTDGFGYVQVDGAHKKIPQVGTVVIEDDVEIGANVTIDRSRFDKTIVGRGTKIDNLVQIAHNVVIGEHCIIIAQVGISGSVNIGRGAILAGQVGVTGHLTVGEGAMVAAQSGVTKSIPAGERVMGFPAREHMQVKRSYRYFWKLPEYLKSIKQLEQRIEALERKLKSTEQGE
jgi:UDP-3-O-[3-hydroxymyristoyl] glucosamine N-acyltransferase